MIKHTVTINACVFSIAIQFFLSSLKKNIDVSFLSSTNCYLILNSGLRGVELRIRSLIHSIYGQNFYVQKNKNSKNKIKRTGAYNALYTPIWRNKMKLETLCRIIMQLKRKHFCTCLRCMHRFKYAI